MRISQDDSIFPSLASLKGTGIIEPRISSLRRRCSNPEDRCSSFLLFRRIASNSIMSWCAGMAAGQPRERSPMPCRFLPLRQDEYCCCGHSERQKRRPSGCGYRDPSDPSRVNATIERIPVSKIDVSNTILSYAADSRCRPHCHGRVRAFPAAGIYSWRDDTWYACLDDQTDIDVALIGCRRETNHGLVLRRGSRGGPTQPGPFAHPSYALVGCGARNIPFIAARSRRFRCLAPGPQDAWCGGRHTVSVLSASSLAKKPRCSQTCRKCVWNISRGQIS